MEAAVNAPSKVRRFTPESRLMSLIFRFRLRAISNQSTQNSTKATQPLIEPNQQEQNVNKTNHHPTLRGRTLLKHDWQRT